METIQEEEAVHPLYLDLDGKWDADELAKRMSYSEKRLGITIENLEVFRTTKGAHVRGTVCYSDGTVMKSPMVAFIQVILGDDWKRGLYCMARIKDGVPGWNILFKRKVAAKRYFYNEKQFEAGDLLSEELVAPELLYELENRLLLRRMMGAGVQVLQSSNANGDADE